jgi:(heptosyl)LPS beta-1,4-glucosyltransferase
LTQRLPLSGVVIARNEGDRIGRCVSSLSAICTDVLVLDSNSTDDTVAIATAAGARVEQQAWLGFAAQKNAAVAAAREPWVLLLDADEWLDPETIPRLRALFDGGEIEQADVWRLQRRTHFLGAALNYGGWGNEAVERLFRADLRYRPDAVHERLDLSGRRVASIPVRIEHDTARSEAEYTAKLQRYARLWAQQKRSEGKHASALSAPLHATAYWIKAVILRGGFLDGPIARRYHALHAGYVREKYRLLRAGFADEHSRDG